MTTVPLGDARTMSRASAAVRAHRYALVVWTAVVVWSAALFAVVRSDFRAYRLGRFDLGNMVQAVWSTAHGRPLETTFVTGEQMSRLAGHVDPILVLLAPLWLVVPSPLTLAVAQIVAVALGALPVFWLTRRHLGSERLAVALALAYLLYPWLAWTALDAVHPVTLAIPLLLFSVWFLDDDRLVPFAICGLLVLATGELMGLTVAALGIWYAVARRRRRAGLAIAGVGVAWTCVALLVIVPGASGGSSRFYGFYEHVGGSPRGIVETAFTNPGAILGEIGDPDVLLYVVALAAPLAGLFVLAPALAAVALPQLVVNALADPAGPVDPRQHYLAAVVPFLVAATVFGVARLRAAARGPAVVTVLGLCLAISVLFGPLAGGRDAARLWYQVDLTSDHVDALDRALELIPKRAPVAASNRVGAHLAGRRYLYSLPEVGDAEWIVLDTQDRWLPDERLAALSERPDADLAALRRRFAVDPRWETVLTVDGVYVFRRLSG